MVRGVGLTLVPGCIQYGGMVISLGTNVDYIVLTWWRRALIGGIFTEQTLSSSDLGFGPLKVLKPSFEAIFGVPGH